jgi:hypothetical protein
VRFIKKNGRVVPIQDKSEPSNKEVKPDWSGTISFRRQAVSTKTRFKRGAGMGALLGFLPAGGIAGMAADGGHKAGAQLAFVGASMAAGALGIGALNAAIGRRSETVADWKLKAVAKKGRAK